MAAKKSVKEEPTDTIPEGVVSEQPKTPEPVKRHPLDPFGELGL